MKAINWLKTNEERICQDAGGFIFGNWLGVLIGLIIFS
jgi:alpha/beta superfamily hydrolase